MKNLYSIIFLVLFAAACDSNDFDLIDLDYSVSLTAIESGLDTAEIGKPIKCVFTLSGLDEKNTNELITTFKAAGEGVIRIDDKEYKSGDAISYDYRENQKFSFDFVPMVAGKQTLILSLSSAPVTHSDSIVLNVLNRDMEVNFINTPPFLYIGRPVMFLMEVKSTQIEITATARFVSGTGRLFIDGFDAQNEEVPIREGTAPVALMAESLEMAVIEFTLTGRYGIPVKKRVVFRVYEN